MYEVFYNILDASFSRSFYNEKAVIDFISKLRKPARIMSGGQHIGRVWKDGRRWQWFFNPELVTPNNACSGLAPSAPEPDPLGMDIDEPWTESP